MKGAAVAGDFIKRLWMSARRRAGLTRRSLEKLPLLQSVVLVISGSLVATATLSLILRIAIPVTSNATDPIDITRLALTVAGGIGAGVALVVAYRRQRGIEQGRFIERFGAAAAQLGVNQAAVRIAGVYAMATIADESAGRQRQQCIDVLCGYLRLPYDPALGSNHQTKTVVKGSRNGDGGSTSEIEESFEYLQNDKEVRHTIVRIIRDRCMPGAEHSWSINQYDFRSAQFDEIDFRGANFQGEVRFSGAKFYGEAKFDGAVFECKAFFDHAKFLGSAGFAECSFSKAVDFEEAVFVGRSAFYSSSFGKRMHFRNATFMLGASFDYSIFRGPAIFVGTKFMGGGEFDSTKFDRGSWFTSAAFPRGVQFSLARFRKKTYFYQTIFGEQSWFVDSKFSGDVTFERARLSDEVRFNSASFRGAASFELAEFCGQCTFEGVRFGVGSITFERPRLWEPPPVFDWDIDYSQKPANVAPDVWPPQPYAEDQSQDGGETAVMR
ncbi:pentapeptide repeat-containing protein [Mycobacteroides franklinii]|uniref:pentapeptide repeat-containing protein n=1 Tax=Mycobacteroides franklinii TaxID=948102 RepID=UPI0013F4D4A6|nr:pentapeptide repeat-containing protein [Mycobacteroides franklinii]